MERAGEHIIHFEIGRPDFDTPEYIKQACEQSLEHGDVFYTSNFGDMELRIAIAEKLSGKNHIPCKPENIIVTAGLSEAVFDVLCTILDEGDEILIPNPVWINYLNVPKLLGAVPVSYSLLEENGWQMNINEVRSKISEKTKAIVIVTPSNPTGGILEQKTLEEIAKLAIEKDLMVIADEIYERIIYGDSKHISIASLPNMAERTITLNGFSKAYSMTGWRLGYACASADLILAINKVHQHNTTCAPSFAQKAAIKALRDEKNEVEEMLREYTRRRDYAVAAINAIPGISCICPKGSFYIFINCKSFNMKSAEIASYLLNYAKIALVPGDVFGSNGEGYLRMSFANSYENIAEGCNRMKNAFASLSR